MNREEFENNFSTARLVTLKNGDKIECNNYAIFSETDVALCVGGMVVKHVSLSDIKEIGVLEPTKKIHLRGANRMSSIKDESNRIAHLKRTAIDDRIEDIIRLLGISFDYEFTKEGSDYWEGVDSNLMRILDEIRSE